MSVLITVRKIKHVFSKGAHCSGLKLDNEACYNLKMAVW